MDIAILHRILLFGRTETRRAYVDQLVRAGEVDVWRVLASTVQSSAPCQVRVRCLEALGLIAASVEGDVAAEILSFLVAGPPALNSAQLSRRENEVAVLVARGLSNRAIAAQLGITIGTVNVHVEHILNKLGVPNRAAIGAWVGERGG